MNLPDVFQNKNIDIKDMPQELFYGNKVISTVNKQKKILEL